MNAPTPDCRQCGAPAPQDLGRIPEAAHFAGQPLPAPLPGGRLLRCRHCRLGFRHPVLAEEDYARLYTAAPAEIWAEAGLRTEHRLVVERLQALRPQGGEVLDLGCSDGLMLAALPAGWGRFGIEASEPAAAIARQRGVQVLGTRFADLPRLAQDFDAVCAIDVIEHVPDPLGLLRALAARLRPGGVLLVASGDLDSPAWQQAGGAYWYCAFGEHLSLISQPWAEAAAAELGLRLTAVQRYTYDPQPGHDAAELQRQRARFSRRVARNRLQQRLHRWSLQRDRVPAVCGVQGLFQDHLLLEFVRRGA